MPIFKKPWRFQNCINNFSFSNATAAVGGLSVLGSFNLGTQNVMPAPTTIFTSSQVTFGVDRWDLTLNIPVGGVAGNTNNFMVDILTQTGSTWTTLLPSMVPNITVANQLWIIGPIDLAIPAGVHIGIAGQSAGVAALAARVNMTLFGGPSDPEQLEPWHGVEVIGANRATSGGASFTPATNNIALTGTAFVTIGVASFDLHALRLGVQTKTTNAVNPTQGLMYQLGINSNPIPGLPIFGGQATTSENIDQSVDDRFYDVMIPAGSAITIRARSTTTGTQQSFQAVLYGAY